MMNTQNLLFLSYSSLFILSLQFFQNCCAKCPPSSCGLIPIRSPFRLSNCGDPGQELVCENNVTLMYVNSRKFFVKAIHYQNFTMRVSDISTDNNICSLPIHSSSDYYDNRPFKSASGYAIKLISLVSCEHPLRNSSLFTQLTECQYSKYTYINVETMRAKDMDSMCTLDTVLATSCRYQDSEFLSNVSLSEIHQSLLYGFDLNWKKLMCLYGKEGVDPDVLVNCDRSDLQRKLDYIKNSFLSPEGPTGGFIMILMFIFAIVFIGVGIAAKIIITITLIVIFRTETEPDWLPGVQTFGEKIPSIVDIRYHFNASNSAIVYSELRIIMGFLCAMGFLIYKFQRRRLSAYEEIESFLQSDNHLSPIRYSYSDIKNMTRNFREKLGEGGFGSVYKGKLRSGYYVAVKLLGKAKKNDRDFINDKDFINEIGTIGRIHHVNVVQLVGYCVERSKRALVLDFMPNGSLDKYIFKIDKTSSLDWDMKFKIAIGAARGIEYLHSGCDIKILHFDIKPHNILLDDKFVPKISDFGLAKLCSVDKDTVTMTVARGTIGYIAPELITRSIGLVSHKADVYSFGMLLMNMAGVNRDLKGNNDDASKYFPCWIYDCINQGKEIGIVEEAHNNVDDVNENGKNALKKMAIVDLWCIQMNPRSRPSMKLWRCWKAVLKT
ncbi:probable serine/threonine-protein kinase At1g01540 [Salvia hispanica]|uniref:probable serine/threonine-protein kinase At1g01540 n=1 Tax=Salvia hispanica TaxID=49212 RepID=UPI0020090DB2|nr:probable serine/threonine-protein kinase At1g01540 [Salvia hispanica]